MEVKNLAALLDPMSGNCGGIVLFIDGMAIKGLPPESCTRDGVDGTVRYRLARAEKSGTSGTSSSAGPPATPGR